MLKPPRNYMSPQEARGRQCPLKMKYKSKYILEVVDHGNPGLPEGCFLRDLQLAGQRDLPDTTWKHIARIPTKEYWNLEHVAWLPLLEEDGVIAKRRRVEVYSMPPESFG